MSGLFRALDSVDEIAIIGMAGRFPGARNLDEFWRNLSQGIESISFFTEEEVVRAGADPAVARRQDYVRARGVLEEAEYFDAGFFGFTPREAEMMDPQHRVFLETAWEVLENAGYDPARYPGAVGVYAGCSMNSYVFSNLLSRPDLLATVGGYQVMLGNDKDFLTTRVSYKLNLNGPSVAVQTACSTSLVAVQLACESLWSGQCDMAIAGGVSVGFPQKVGYLYQPGMILSPDGHCRAFDAKAQGMLGGEGVGAVLLKRLAAAIAEQDHIHAVIKGAATNNDGSQKVGYTAPSVDGQAQVIARALAMGKVEPDTVSYVEAHGTGTELGDPIEVAALTQAFRARTVRTGFCAIGSVKTNIGHLDAAAGIAGLIKTVLALKHKQIPPSLHFERPNPQIDFASSPFYVSAAPVEWKSDLGPRRAGVSSFGIGGTNAHVVLEEAPPPPLLDRSRPVQLLTLSAKSEAALTSAATRMADYLAAHPEVNLADVAFTLHCGRRSFPHRSAVVANSLAEATALLRDRDQRRAATSVVRNTGRPVAYLFPGQGSQYPGMSRGLYESEPVFQEHVDSCAEVLKARLGFDVRETLFPAADPAMAAEQLRQSSVTQPALFTIEYSLARLWMSWGITPDAMLGHSLGEYVAACVAGVFSLEEALALVAERGRLMQIPGGSMLVVSLSASAVEEFLDDDVSLAATNAPTLSVVSGAVGAIQALQTILTSRGIPTQAIHTAHAFHSRMMEPILGDFTEAVKRVTLRPPAIPFVSNLTGAWITAAEATDPTYWARHLRSTVRFADGLGALLERPDLVLLEVGPGRTLASLARQNSASGKDRMVFTSLRHPQDQQPDMRFLLDALGRLWLAGVDIDWDGVHQRERRRRVPLPTYPFESQRHLVEPALPTINTPVSTVPARRDDVGEWFSIPSWKRSAPATVDSPALVASRPNTVLLFADDRGLASRLGERLGESGRPVVTVVAGNGFEIVSDRAFVVEPQSRDDYGKVLAELRHRDLLPTTVVHCWNVACPGGSGDDLAVNPAAGFHSLLCIAQALTEPSISHRIEFLVVSNRLHEVAGEDTWLPQRATLQGPCTVIPQEFPEIRCRNVDIAWSGEGPGVAEAATQLLGEVNSSINNSSVVAYRGGHRWVRTYEPIRLESAGERVRLRQGGTYLITGGLGGIGLVLAQHLARRVGAKLILIGRKGLPPRAEWPEWLAKDDGANAAAGRIRAVQALEASGSEVMVIAADVTEPGSMQAAIQSGRARFGAIHGVIHAAGLPGGGLIQLKTLSAANEILAPKVAGTIMLEQLCRDQPPDFLFLCSSITAILGGVGQVDYCAANAFLDAFAQSSRLAQRGTSVVAANWDTWQEVGMAVTTEVPTALKRQREELLKDAIRPAEGIDAFERILASPFHQVVISTRDLLSLVRGTADVRPGAPVAGGGAAVGEAGEPLGEVDRGRDGLSNEYAAPRSELEVVIAEIWSHLLGVSRVGVHDDFFELGGHSLMATQLMSRLYETFKLEVPLRTVFEAPTVAGLAERVDALRWAAEGAGARGASDEREELEL